MIRRFSLKPIWFVGGIFAAAGTATFLDGATFRVPDPLLDQVDFEAHFMLCQRHARSITKKNELPRLLGTTLVHKRSPKRAW